MDFSFVSGAIQAIDGEKDPRVLLFCFKIMKSIIGNFQLKNLVEELFEVVSCYFPIDFKPPSSIPVGHENYVSPTELKSLLK